MERQTAVAQRAMKSNFKSGNRVAVILGAGATKACDGPLTGEILPTSVRADEGRATRATRPLPAAIVQRACGTLEAKGERLPSPPDVTELA